MRLFLAIELPGPVRAHLAQVQRALRAVAGDVSWTRSEKLHLTLKFLGETAEPQVAVVAEALRAVPRPGPLELEVQGLECLPPRGPVRVIGAAVAGDLEQLRWLQRDIEQLCADLGYAPEGRVYRPHITLARARRPLPPGMRMRLVEAAAGAGPTRAFAVEEFILFQSRLSSAGAEHTPLARFGLQG